MTEARILEPAASRLLSPGLNFTAVLEHETFDTVLPFDLVQFSLEAGAGSEPGAMDISEIWSVIAGTGRLTVEDAALNISAGNFVFIPAGATHAILNIGSKTLTVVSIAWPPPSKE